MVSSEETISAIIGGTGIDEAGQFQSGRIERVSTPFGEADVVRGELSGIATYFVPRHGTGHATPPSLINYRAQIAALKKLGVERVIGVCSVGSLRVNLPAGSLAVLGDFIDLTKRRADTFFDQPGAAVHTDLSCPYCPEISRALVSAAVDCGQGVDPAATYIGVEGPRYETLAEIRLYASWGGDVVGMTNVPEVVLAREAGLCYGAIAVVTNLAAGLSPRPLAHEDVVSAFKQSTQSLLEVLIRALKTIPLSRSCECGANARLVF